MAHDEVYGICENKCLVRVEPKAKTDAVEARVTALEDGKAPNNHATTAETYGIGTGSNYGHVKLSDSVSSTSSDAGIAASPKAVKSVADRVTSLEEGMPVPVKAKFTTTNEGYGCVIQKNSGLITSVNHANVSYRVGYALESGFTRPLGYTFTNKDATQSISVIVGNYYDNTNYTLYAVNMLTCAERVLSTGTTGYNNITVNVSIKYSEILKCDGAYIASISRPAVYIGKP